MIVQHLPGNHGSELATLMHRGAHVERARQRLHAFIHDLIAEASQAGDLRDDIAADELASFCLHALTAASNLPSRAAAERLVAVTLAGLRSAPPA
jgi:hypothetical protein